jgi:hypothetical protein
VCQLCRPLLAEHSLPAFRIIFISRFPFFEIVGREICVCTFIITFYGTHSMIKWNDIMEPSVPKMWGKSERVSLKAFVPSN